MATTALITGASSGIGMELARIHAASRGNLVLVARRRERLEALKAELEGSHGVAVTVIDRDLSTPDAAESLFDEVEGQGLTIDHLMNNAGFGGHGKFHERPWSDDAAMIRLNVLALTGLTRLFLPGMVARGRGHVLNVASMAGFLPGPLQAVYFATKAYVVSFSEAIANELKGTGVTVTALCPGPVATEFADRANLRGVKGFSHAMSADEVAEAGYRAMLRGTPIIVPGAGNKLAIHGLIRLLPRGLLTRVSRKAMEKR